MVSVVVVSLLLLAVAASLCSLPWQTRQASFARAVTEPWTLLDEAKHEFVSTRIVCESDMIDALSRLYDRVDGALLTLPRTADGVVIDAWAPVAKYEKPVPYRDRTPGLRVDGRRVDGRVGYHCVTLHAACGSSMRATHIRRCRSSARTPTKWSPTKRR